MSYQEAKTPENNVFYIFYLDVWEAQSILEVLDGIFFIKSLLYWDSDEDAIIHQWWS